MQIFNKQHTLFAALATILILAGCSDIEAPNLDQTPNNTNNTPDANNTPDPCNGACSSTTHCDATTKACVACVENSHCPSAELTNYAGICTTNKCEIAANKCADGFIDLDGKADNGCECKITDDNDLPDIEGTDSNCDGADGVGGKNGNVIYVHPKGDTRNNGFTHDKPLPTITSALSAADNTRPYILVVAGNYSESIILKNGINIFGGYNQDTWKRDITANETVIKGNGQPDPRTKLEEADHLGHYKTVTAHDIKDKTILSGLTIVGQNATTTNKSASTFALWSENSENLLIHDSLFIGGKASDGKNGQPGRKGDHPALNCQPAIGGDGGEEGSRHWETAIIPCFLSIAATHANHGKLGAIAIDGAGSSNPADQNGGKHTCGHPTDQTHGGPGDHGQPGATGLNSQPRDSDYLGGFVFRENNSTTWHHVPHKQSATNGRGGNGGQGGGAAGNIRLSNHESEGTWIGIAGSNGGNGGCGGEAGENGFAGGSSFGVLVLKGQVSFHNTGIQLGTGGTGGLAGTSGTGTLGQPGAPSLSPLPNPPNPPHPTLSNGGKGGNGGNGGDGGKTLGGPGGHAIGIAYTEHDSIINAGQVTYNIELASGGKGQEGQEGWETSQKRDGQILESQKIPTHD